MKSQELGGLSSWILWGLGQLVASTLLAQSFGSAEFDARTAILLTPTFHASPVTWSLHEDGRVYFEAIRVASDENGLHITGGAGGSQAIFEGGDPAPDLPGLQMFGPSEWVAVDDGYAFAVRLEGPGVNPDNDIALYAGTLASGPRLIFREGDEVPLLPGSFFDFGATLLRVNHSGTVFFQVQLESGPASTAWMVDSGGDLTLVATGSSTAVRSAALASRGALALVGFFDGAWRVWAGEPGSLATQISEGDAAPGTVAAISELETVSFSGPGRMAVAAALTNGNDALFSDVGGSPRLVEESALLLSDMTSDTIGRLAFKRGTGPGEAVLSEQGGVEPSVLAAVGDPAPGLDPEVEYFSFNGTPIANRFRQVAYAATLAGTGVGAGNDFSLWIYDPFFGDVVVAREGSTIQIAPADTRSLESIVSGFSFVGGSNLQDGVPKSFNQRGEVAFLANFTDGDTAILVAQRQSPDVTVFTDGFESGNLANWSSQVP
ncbi:MAG: hypothetical protein MPN21_07735 [Thermoanaerobaculia bacterium]|nr:hypothetical protein [Thermoanaerobaculia bacterium]